MLAELRVLEDATKEEFDDALMEHDATTAIQIAWDMFMLKPPAIVCRPKKYTQVWHQDYGPLWDDQKPAESLVYLRPLLLYGAGGSVATKALVGNRSMNDIRVSNCSLTCRCKPHLLFKWFNWVVGRTLSNIESTACFIHVNVCSQCGVVPHVTELPVNI